MIFDKAVLTDRGKKLIAKMQAKGEGIRLTKARTGSGSWAGVSEPAMAQSSALREKQQEFTFSDIDLLEGTSGVVKITVIIHNQGLKKLYMLRELGIYAEDPDDGEILYYLLINTRDDVYVPADGENGIASFIEEIYTEVCNAESTMVEMRGAFASAIDFAELRKLTNQIRDGLKGGEVGERLVKQDGPDLAFGWEPDNTFIGKKANFPETGSGKTIYIDPDSSSVYVWRMLDSGSLGYFKLALGADAAETLQQLISTNRDNIAHLAIRVQGLEDKNQTMRIKIPAAGWTESTSGGVMIYTNEVQVAGMTDKYEGTVWEVLVETEPTKILAENKAINTFKAAAGTYDSGNGKLIARAYGKRPQADFTIELVGKVGA